MTSFGVLAADDEREARRQVWVYSHAMMRMSQRKSFVVPTLEEVEVYPYSPSEREIIEMWNAKIMNRTGGQVVEQLNAWQRRIGADELMVLNLGHSPAAIQRSTEIIADAYGMPDSVADGQPLGPHC